VPTALITGGHAGIGFECAKQLASRTRYNLVLAGWSMERIEAAAQQLRMAYGIRVSTLTRSSRLSYDEQRALKLWSDSKTLVRLQPNEESVRCGDNGPRGPALQSARVWVRERS
jgi:NAD(P)-dependent dehydrogenase (short-subunit alcohol dehydrogenase family)